MAEYSADDIEVLKGLEPVRKRPGMYVGDTTDGSGLHHLLWEAVGNVVDQHLAAYASELRVELASNGWVSVSDDGGGIPVDAIVPPSAFVAHEPRPLLEVVFTTLHGAPTYDGHFPHVHVGGPYGVGIAAVNALCERLQVETTRDGARWSQSYERGEPVSALRRLGPTRVEGTTIRFLPDHLIFGDIALDAARVHERLSELAWLNPHLRVWFQERRIAGRGGALGWARQLAQTRGRVAAAFGVTHATAAGRVDIGLAWSTWNESSCNEITCDANTRDEPLVRAFVNMRETPRGTHVDGIWRALERYARSRKAAARRLSTVREALEPGLVAVIHVGMYHPRFGAPTHDQLVSPEATKAVEAGLAAYFASSSSLHVRAFLDNRLGTGRG